MAVQMAVLTVEMRDTRLVAQWAAPKASSWAVLLVARKVAPLAVSWAAM